jgi:hypothetical protein
MKLTAAFLLRMQAIAFSSRRGASVILRADFAGRIAANTDSINIRRYFRAAT